MAVNDVHEIILVALSNDQAMVNKFHYLTIAGSPSASALAGLVDTQIVPKIKACVSQSTHFNTVRVRNLMTPTDFATLAIDQQGSVAGENMPLHDAISFTYRVSRNDARSGGKRFGQLIEGTQNNGIPMGTMITNLGALEATLEASWTVGGGAVVPCVYGTRNGSLGKFANQLSGVAFFGFTTQNTRKFYTSMGV